MKIEKMLREIIAIQFYDEEARAAKVFEPWCKMDEEDRESYRELVDKLFADEDVSDDHEELETERAFVLSTAHITEDANKYLLGNGWWRGRKPTLIFDSYKYGWRIYVGELDGPICSAGPHVSLHACMELARKNGCMWLKLDRDGPIVDSLPKYEW